MFSWFQNSTGFFFLVISGPFSVEALFTSPDRKQLPQNVLSNIVSLGIQFPVGSESCRFGSKVTKLFPTFSETEGCIKDGMLFFSRNGMGCFSEYHKKN